jgi:hypothetical protein
MLAASSAPRWGFCEASPLLEAQFPDVETEEAAEGTASHWVAEQSLLSCIAADKEFRPAGMFVGEKAANGLIVNDAMCEAAGQYVSDVLKIVNEHGAKKLLRVEQSVHASFIHNLCGGTSDAVLYLPDLHRLYIWDYKFGHAVVEAERNLQLVVYYAGLYNLLGLNGATDQTLDVRFRVVQPRAFHREGTRREWRTTGGELRTLVNQLTRQAELVFSNGAKARSGNWCRDCKAAVKCEANRSRAGAAMCFIDKPILTSSDPHDLGYELQIIDQAYQAIKERRNALKQVVESTIENGGVVPGWSRETSSTPPKWTLEPKEIIQLGQANGVDLAKIGVKSPTQAESLGLNPDLIQMFSKRGRSEPKLIESSKTLAFKAFFKDKE